MATDSTVYLFSILKTMKIVIIVMCIWFLRIASLHAQANQQTAYPRIGDAFPEHLFEDVENYQETSFRVRDFRGKWLILDFWSLGCISCINSFPKMDSLAQQFKDKVQLVVVGSTGHTRNPADFHRRTKDLYHRLAKKNSLKFTVAFDSTIANTLKIGSVPFIYVIDENGVIRYKTSRVDDAEVSLLLKGGKPSFPRAYSIGEPKANFAYNERVPLLTAGIESNGGIDTAFLFRSLLTPYNEAMPDNPTTVNFDKNRPQNAIATGRFEIFRQFPERLYTAAFFGVNTLQTIESGIYDSLHPTVIWNIKNQNFTKELYSYSLKVPKERASKELFMKCLQQDLEKTFGYKASVQKRMMPVYFIEIDDDKKAKKLISPDQSAKRDGAITTDRIHIVNAPLIVLLNNLDKVIKFDAPVRNMTGITENINIDFRTNFASPDVIMENLKKYGLRVIKRDKEMKVIVVEDQVLATVKN